MNKNVRGKIYSIYIRYTILLVFAFIGFSIFYFIFKPLTLHISFFLFDLLSDAYILNDVIYFYNSNISLAIIGACVAGSAYFLFLMLNLSTPNIKLKKRLSMLVISFIAFLFINTLRIFLVGLLFINSVPWAEAFHKFLWYFGSIFMVILIWFIEVKCFKINGIPFYSDLKFIFNYVKKK